MTLILIDITSFINYLNYSLIEIFKAGILMKKFFTILIFIGAFTGLNAQEFIASGNTSKAKNSASPENIEEDTTAIASINNKGKIDAYSEASRETKKPSPEELPIKNILEQFRIYPNPTSSFINIFNPSGDFIEFSVKIIDSAGKEIVSRDNLYSSFPFRYDAETLAPGIYLVVLSFDKTSISRKIMVE